MTISDIDAKISFFTKTNTTNFPVPDRLIFVNTAYNRVASLIMRCDDRWQYDDTNYTDLPIATTALVSGQQDYSLATLHLTIDRVELLDTGSKWHLLDPIDQHEVDREALAQHFPTPGLPVQYDKLGNSIFLYPTPNYSQAASLKLYFTRGPSEFSSADVIAGTKTPGFNSLFHDLIPLWVAFDYATTNAMPTANGFLAEIQRKEQELVNFYGLRDRDERRRMTVSTNGGDRYSASGQLYSGAGGDSNK